MNEEERRRKILIDSQVIEAATLDLRDATNGNMTAGECRALIALDEEYLRRRENIQSRERS